MRRTLPLFSLLLGLGLGLGVIGLSGCGDGEVVEGGCTKDADCKGARICDYDTGKCTLPGDECEVDADCDTASGQLCHLEEKRCWTPECVETADCQEGFRCDQDQLCVEKDCESNLQCDPGLFCEPGEGLCVQCARDADCDVGLACVDYTCQTADPCWLNDPHTCDGTKYQDQNAGAYPSDGYPKMLLRDPQEGVGVRQVGTSIPLGGVQAGATVGYWPLTSYDPTSTRPLSIFGSATEARVGRVWQLVDADFNPVGRPILENQPHGSRFSPLNHFIYVQAPPPGSGYEPDMIKSVVTLKKAMEDPKWGEKRFRLDVGHDADIVAFQPVDPAVTLDVPMGVPSASVPRVREWWFEGQLVTGFVMPTSETSPYVPVRSVSGDPLSEPPTPFVPRAFLVYYDEGTRLRACSFGGTSAWNASPAVFEAGFGEATYSPVIKGETVLIPAGGVDYGTACASVPTNYAGVSEKINAGDYTVDPAAVFMVNPQLP